MTHGERVLRLLSLERTVALHSTSELVQEIQMNTRNIVMNLLSGALMLSGAVTNAAASGTAEQAVAAAENQMIKALQTNNMELYGSFLADKYVQTDQDGRVLLGKAATLADMKTYIFNDEELSDLQVTVYGDTAIATGTFLVKVTYQNKPTVNRGRFTDTWVKLDGKWQLVAEHSSMIRK